MLLFCFFTKQCTCTFCEGSVHKLSVSVNDITNIVHTFTIFIQIYSIPPSGHKSSGQQTSRKYNQILRMFVVINICNNFYKKRKWQTFTCVYPFPFITHTLSTPSPTYMQSRTEYNSQSWTFRFEGVEVGGGDVYSTVHAWKLFQEAGRCIFHIRNILSEYTFKTLILPTVHRSQKPGHG